MSTTLYVIWFGIPVVFLLIGLWSWLERIGGKSRKENTGDYIKQGFVVLLAALLSLAIDALFLESIVSAVFPEWVPLALFRILLFPVVLYVMALLLGPSRAIMIAKAPRPSQRWTEGNRARKGK